MFTDEPGELADGVASNDGPFSSPFSHVRGVDLDPRLVASRRLRDAIARSHENGDQPIMTHVVAHLANVFVDLETQIVELREELDRLRGN
jgi:hypothetical protein